MRQITMPSKTKLTPEQLADRIVEISIEGDLRPIAAADILAKSLEKYQVTIPLTLKQKACEIADKKLGFLDRVALSESQARGKVKKKLKEQAARPVTMFEAKLPKVTAVETWDDWAGETPKNLQIWRDTGVEYKPILSKIKKIPYVYHGTSLKDALNLLRAGIRKSEWSGSGLNATTDIGYATSYSAISVSNNPKLVIAIVAIPTNLIDWKVATLSDNYDELQNLQIHNKIPGNKLKIVKIGTSAANLKKAQAMLSEQNLPDQPQQMADFQAPPQKPISLDQVVDRYIVRYERESIPLEGKPNGPGIAPLPGSQPAGGSQTSLEETKGLEGVLQFLLSEQAAPEDEPPAEDAASEEAPPGGDDMGGGLGDAPDLGGDEGGGMMDEPGGEPAPEESTPVVNTPQINLNEFARSIARLVNNYDALLNPRTIILNRVEAYLRSNYNETTAKYFMQIMERNYGLHVTSIEYPEDKNTFPTVYGVGAFAGGAGGGG